jgi:hypothetical protein
MMKKLLLIVLLLLAVRSFSQVKDTAKVTVYEPFSATQTVDMQKDIVYEKNMVKWNMGMLLRGAFEMDFEHCLTDKFTVEVGAGVTYVDLASYAVSNDADLDFENTTFKYGPVFAGDIKFYPHSAPGFEGMYFSIPVRIRDYYSEKKLTYNINNISVTNTFNSDYKHFEFGFIVGNQSGDYWDVTWDYFFGIGINSTSSNTPVYSINDIPVQTTQNKVTPVIFCGFKLGFAF